MKIPCSARSNETKVTLWSPQERGTGDVTSIYAQELRDNREMPLNHSQDPNNSDAKLSKAQVRRWKEGQRQMRTELRAVRLVQDKVLGSEKKQGMEGFQGRGLCQRRRRTR